MEIHVVYKRELNGQIYKQIKQSNYCKQKQSIIAYIYVSPTLCDVDLWPTFKKYLKLH